MTKEKLTALVTVANPYFCNFITMNLKKLGFRNIWSEHEAEKLKKLLDSKNPDLIFVDVSGSSDLELFDLFRTKVPDSIIIALLKFKDNELVETVLNHGAASFLVQPYNAVDIKRAVEYMLLSKFPDTLGNEKVFFSTLFPELVRFFFNYLKNLGLSKTYEELQTFFVDICKKHSSLLKFNKRTKTLVIQEFDEELEKSLKILKNEVFGRYEELILKSIGKDGKKFLMEVYSIFFLKNFHLFPFAKIFLNKYTTIDLSNVENTLDQYYQLQNNIRVLDEKLLQLIAFKSDLLGVSSTAKAGAKILSEGEEMKYGSFLYAATALGSEYYTGLFGPVPVPGNPDYLAVYYTEILKDPTSPDPRLQNRNYVLICLIYHKSMEHIFSNRLPLEVIFRRNLSSEDYIEKINEKFLKKLFVEIVQTYKK